MKSLLKYGLAIVLFSTTLSFGQAAFGSPPENIGKTTWKGTANNEAVSVTIGEQQPHNPAQISVCRSISGYMTPQAGQKGEDFVNGFYCPETGAFAFSRLRNEDRALMQVYRGSLSSDGNSMKGTFLYMSGNWGEYNFSASK
jgi:hypothetical protein